MPTRKKPVAKEKPKTSILSYFSVTNNGTNESGKELPKSKRLNDNNNALKRKTTQKHERSGSRKKQKITSNEPIVISSEDEEDVDSDFQRTERRQKVPGSSRKSSVKGGLKPFSSLKKLSTASCKQEIEVNKVSRSSLLKSVGGQNMGNEQNLENEKENESKYWNNVDQNFGKSVSSSSDCQNKEDSKIDSTEVEVRSKSGSTANHGHNSACLRPSLNSSERDENSRDLTMQLEKAGFDECQRSSEDEDDIEEEVEEKIAYYLLNFQQILDTVLENKDDRSLFEGSDDMTWINRFQELPLQAQKLYVRLYHRKVAWLRLDQVNYPDISKNIKKVLKILSQRGFLLWFNENDTNDLELPDILKLLPAPALKDLAKSFKVNVNGRQKNQITDDLCKMCKKQRSVIGGFFAKKSPGKQRKNGLSNNVMKRACMALGPCYKVAPYPRTAFNRVLLVFDVTRGIDDETECTLTGSQNSMGQGRHLQLSAVLMAGMGKVSYPTCEVHRPTPIFSSRKDLLHYETAFQFQTDVLACVEAGQWQEAAALCDSANAVKEDIETNDQESCKHADNLPEFLRCFTAQWTYKRLRSLEVEVLQRLKNYKKAVDILQELLDQRIYCTARRGHWWERLALNVDQHLKDPLRSLDVIYESLQDAEVRVGHKLALAQRVSKILSSRSVKKMPQLTTTYKTKLKPVFDRLEIQDPPVVEITGRLLPTDVQTGKSRFIATENDDGDVSSESTFLCSVEELALNHYKSLGYDHGIHGEGGTFSTLFCLFLWDIIFMSGIPDVFRTKYQTHPLDYHTDGFYLGRQEDIEKRLTLIEILEEKDFTSAEQEDDTENEQSSSALDILSLTWDTQYGKACAGMNWERFTSLEEAKGFIKCIGGKVLSGIFRRLAKDLRHTRSGLPDLVVWNPVKSIYKMVEVKGPGDRLSTNQKLWIDELIQLGANIEVCKVIAIGGKKLSRK